MQSGVQVFKLARELKSERRQLRSPATKGFSKFKIAARIKAIRSEIKGKKKNSEKNSTLNNNTNESTTFGLKQSGKIKDNIGQ